MESNPVDSDRAVSCKHRRRSTETMVLPEDIFFEVLTRLPVKAILRFRSVCKSWHAMISNPIFVRLHLEQSKKKVGALILPLALPKFDPCPRTITFYRYPLEGGKEATALCKQELPEEVKEKIMYLQHCDGLVVTCTMDQMYVCNPTTREFRVLPKASCNLLARDEHHGDTLALGFDSYSKTYKVVRHFYRRYDFPTKSCSVGVEVLTLGSADATWRLTPEDPPYPVHELSAVSANGGVYWRIYTSLHPSAPVNSLLFFDVHTEKFTVVPAPPAPLYFERRLMEFGNKLCYFYAPLYSSTSEVWVMTSNDPANPEWDRLCSVTVKYCLLWFTWTMLTQRHGKILLQWNYKELSYFEPQTNTFESTVIMESDLLYSNPTTHEFEDISPQKPDFLTCSFTESMVKI